jgi:hypothetical protein
MELTAANRPDLRDLLEADSATLDAAVLEAVRAECTKNDLVPPADSAAISQQVTGGPHGPCLHLAWDTEVHPPDAAKR